MKNKFIPILAVLLFSLSGCSYLQGYRPPIQQGNAVNGKKLTQLKLGMTKTQVRFLLGDSLVVDPFDPDRWDYTNYYLPSSATKPRIQQMTLWFSAGHLVRIIENGKNILQKSGSPTSG